MSNKYRHAAGDRTLPVGLLKGVLAGIALTLVGTGVMSWLIIREVLQETATGYAAMVVLLMSSFFCSLIAARSSDAKRIYTSALAGLLYYAVLMGANALFFKGEYQGIGVTALLIAAGSMTAVMVRGKGKRRRNMSGRKIRHA